MKNLARVHINNQKTTDKSDIMRDFPKILIIAYPAVILFLIILILSIEHHSANAIITPFAIDHPQQLTIKTGDGKDMVIRSGVALIHFNGPDGNFRQWARDQLVIRNIGPIWKEKPAAITSMTTNTITSQDTPNGMGVDSVLPAEFDSNTKQLTLKADIAALWKSQLTRVGFYVIAVGHCAFHEVPSGNCEFN